MHSLNISKVAVGCPNVEALAARLTGRAQGEESVVVTRYRPTRHVELVGGSLFWIIKHQIVARSPILRFEETEEGRCAIRIAADLVSVRMRPRRAHQGWRYLPGPDAPDDLDGAVDDPAAMPRHLVQALAALALV